MFHRSINLPPKRSFFLFGPRGTGKSTLLRSLFPKAYIIDLLDIAEEDLFHRNPLELRHRIERLSSPITPIIIDEIQKAPRLLDLVHQLIESTRHPFILTGSSARKLKRGAANLLAGRAFVYNLFPLIASELGATFHLKDALMWGTLPKIYSMDTQNEKNAYLRAYALTYLKEEIAAEQIVRRLDSFRNFLTVAAQSNGQILNYTNIARDVGVDIKTVQSFFQILEDTLIGFLLEPFHESIRKRQRENPKFYFFDTGVTRALQGTLTVELTPQTYAYGAAFEHFVINEIRCANAYKQKDYRLSYLRTKDDAEIDLIIERPGLRRALIEIKSTEHIRETDLQALRHLAADIPNSQAFCFSRDPHAKTIHGMSCLPWQQGLQDIGL